MNLRATALIAAYRLFPFSLKGDIQLEDIKPDCDISCVINFYGRIDLLEGILYSLSGQDLSKKNFEVILIEDRNGTIEGRNVAERFGAMLNIKYFPLAENFGTMGYSRNFGLSKTKGKYILFLDDDTIILQDDFLSKLLSEFTTTGADAIVPCGSASYCVLDGKYSFHDLHFPTSRCMAYNRNILRELCGFVSDIIGQEDVEFIIRFLAAGRKLHSSENLNYLHPPLILNNLNKAAAVGMSFAKLYKRYPLIIWLMLLLNGSRYLPLLLFPVNTKWRMQGRFSLGFLLGIIYPLLGKRIDYS